MLLALTDHLRCTGAHAETWLVARADKVELRRMVHGVLGCPVCRTERAVRSGVLYWNADPAASAPAGREPTLPDIDADAMMRTGALLGYAESAAPYVLCGREGLAAAALSGLADAPLVLIDPPDDRAAAFATIIRGAPRIPLAPGSARGVVLSGAEGTELVTSAPDVLSVGGRLVAPATIPLPPGTRELARDERQWVAERAADVITIGRAPRER